MYDPPYDSPIEEIFAHNVAKYLRDDVRLEKQVKAPTPWGIFRMDFVLMTADKTVAVECDGREFHEKFRDEFRDALILGTRAVQTIYHFRGCDLYHQMELVLDLLCSAEPQFFSERGVGNIRRLISNAGCRPLGRFQIARRSVDDANRAHWRFLFDWARERGTPTFDRLIELYLKEARQMRGSKARHR